MIMSKKKKQKQRFSKIIVTLVVIMNIIFTGTTFYVFLKTGNEPASLITAWFAFTTGELWMLGSIKKAKVKKGDNESDGN